ncbi:MAG: cache domain-containing protein [Candidatus Falkowbacteria bacterium]|nr:cache domain-containing protein [Candidatus Falkowbacteria bacterium]
MFKKIGNKIIFSYAGAFFLIILLVAIVINIYTANIIRNNLYSYFHSSNRARAEHIRTFIQDEKKTASILAAASIYRDFLKTPSSDGTYSGLKEKINKRLTRTIEADPNIYEAFIISSDGKIVASSKPENEGIDRSTDPLFTNAKDSVFLKDVYFSDVIKRFNYTISAPVKDDNGTMLGVSVLRYLPNNFFSIVNNENGLGKSEENFLINKDRLFLTPSLFLGEDVVMTQKVETENANDCFDPKEVDYVQKNGYKNIVKEFGNQITEAKDYRKIDVIATHSYIPETGWCLITKVDRSELFSFQGYLGEIFAVIILLGILIFILVGLLVSRKITKPIKRLMAGVQNVKNGNLDSKIEIDTHDEIAIISAEFNHMTDSLKRSGREIKKKVSEQTSEITKVKDELESKYNESSRLNKLVVGREMKMIELKHRISELENQLVKKKK